MPVPPVDPMNPMGAPMGGAAQPQQLTSEPLCPVCGQQHAPGTPCPISPTNALQPATGAGGGIAPYTQPVSPPRPQTVVTHERTAMGDDDMGDVSYFPEPSVNPWHDIVAKLGPEFQVEDADRGRSGIEEALINDTRDGQSYLLTLTSTEGLFEDETNMLPEDDFAEFGGETGDEPEPPEV